MSFGNAAKSGFTLEDLTKMGPDEITRKRKIAEALLAQSQGIHPIANPLEGMAQMAQALIGNLKGAYLDRKEREGKSDANALFSAGMGMGEFPPAPGAKAAPSGSASSGSGMRGDDIAWKDATPEQRAFLNTLAGPESGGRYNVIYGGGRFNDFSHHPGQSVRIQTGPNAGRTSSAAGKYQFLGETWKGVAAEIGLPDFSPESQDKGAWHLADKTFKAKTGQDLLTVLKSGDPKAIAAAGSTLRDVWTSLPGGIEQGTNQDRFVASYQKYLGQGASPAQAQAAATQETGAPAPKGPVQVASNDPAIGVQQAMVEQGQDPNDPLSQALVKLKQNNPDGSTAPVVPLPDQAAIGAALTGARPSAAVGSVPPLPTPAAQVPMPAPPGAPAAQAPLPQQQQMAQALIQPQDPAQTLGAPAISPQGPDMRTLMNMAGNEFMSPQQQKMIEALTGQRMKQADPEYQMGLRKSQLELDALEHPKLSPAQQAELEWKQKEFDAARGDKKAEYDLNVQKFGAEEADRMRQQADREADNARADSAEERQRRESLTTTNIKDYEAYKRDEVNAGRTPLGRLEYEQALRKSGASTSNVTVGGGKYGTIPPGYELREGPDGATLVQIPKVNAKSDKQLQAADLVTQDIDRSLKAIDTSSLPSTGMVGDWLSKFGGTQARDVKGLLDTVKANIGFDQLQAMRDASPTGGALGQVTEQELALLQSVAGNLEQSQGKDQLKDNLNRVWNMQMDIIHGKGQGPERRKLSFQPDNSQPAAPTTEDEYNALPSGALFVDPDDGKTYKKP